MNMSFGDLTFFIIAAITILAALGMVLSRNIVHSALALILSFIAVAGLFFSLGAGFLGLVQILVYAGAISVLIIFAVMLVMRGDAGQSNLFNSSLGTHLWGVFLASLLTVSLSAAIYFSEFASVKGKPVEDDIGLLAELMLGKYVVAFEAAAVLLLLAVVGAIILARGAEEQ